MGWHWPGVIVLLSWYDWTRPETLYHVHNCYRLSLDSVVLLAYAKLQLIIESYSDLFI